MLIDKHKAELKLEDKQFKDLKEAEKHNSNLLNVYSLLLDNMKKEVENTKSSDFEISNWPYYRAYQDGIIKGIDKALNLIKTR